MTQSGEDDFGLRLLLDLDGEVFPMDNGYWTKFEAKIVTPTSSIPHGVRYSLTLHQRNNKRILGYDNAHGFKPRNKRYAGNRLVWDHKHDRGQVEFYEFESAGTLLEDFWNDVDRILNGK
jgi:hypothetical protein